jgi:hypothetical protein
MQRFRSEVRIFVGKRSIKGSGGAVAFSQISGNGLPFCPRPAVDRMGLAEIFSPDLFKCEGDHDLLDSGATVMLLGSALTGLGLVRHYLKRFRTSNKNPDTLLLPFINSCSPVTIALLECFGDQGSDGLFYTHLFREKNCAKHVAKYHLLQTAMP